MDRIHSSCCSNNVKVCGPKVKRLETVSHPTGDNDDVNLLNKELLLQEHPDNTMSNSKEHVSKQHAAFFNSRLPWEEGNKPSTCQRPEALTNEHLGKKMM